MKTTLIGAATAILLGSCGFAAAQMGAGTTTGGGNVCLWAYQIDHTHVVDPSTVLFYMKDGHVWRNDLQGRCPGLAFNGFTFVTPSDTICSNAVPIKVIRTGETCSLGKFSPYMHAER